MYYMVTCILMRPYISARICSVLCADMCRSIDAGVCPAVLGRACSAVCAPVTTCDPDAPAICMPSQSSAVREHACSSVCVEKQSLLASVHDSESSSMHSL